MAFKIQYIYYIYFILIAACEDIRFLNLNAGFAARGRRSRGRPPSRRGWRSRVATMILNDIQEVEGKKYLFLLFVADMLLS